MVILPEIPQGRRTSPWRRQTERRRTGPHKRDVIGTNPEEATPERSKQHSKQPPHKHGMMRKQVWFMSGLMKHGMAKVHKQSYKLSGDQYATSCLLTKHHNKLFSSISFMYPTILNVDKHGKRGSMMKLSNLGKFKWGRNNKTTSLEIPHVHILGLVLICPKHNFRVVKHVKWSHHVKLGIFPPHLHIKFIQNRATVI